MYKVVVRLKLRLAVGSRMMTVSSGGPWTHLEREFVDGAADAKDDAIDVDGEEWLATTQTGTTLTEASCLVWREH